MLVILLSVSSSLRIRAAECSYHLPTHRKHLNVPLAFRRPGLIGKMLDLKRGGNNRYQKTAAYGHFGRSDPDFTWEHIVPLGK